MDDILLLKPEYLDSFWITLKHSLIVTAILTVIFSYPVYLAIKREKKAFKIRDEYNEGIEAALTSKHAKFLLDSYIREAYTTNKKEELVVKYGNPVHMNKILIRLQERLVVLEQLKL